METYTRHVKHMNSTFTWAQEPAVEPGVLPERLLSAIADHAEVDEYGLGGLMIGPDWLQFMLGLAWLPPAEGGPEAEKIATVLEAGFSVVLETKR